MNNYTYLPCGLAWVTSWNYKQGYWGPCLVELRCPCGVLVTSRKNFFLPALLSSLHVRAFYTKPLSNMEMISCWKICSAGFLSLLATFAKCIFWSNLDLCMSFLKYAWYINILTVIYHNVWIQLSCSAHVLYSIIPRLTCQVPETTCSVVKIPVPSQAKLHKQWCLFDQARF